VCAGDHLFTTTSDLQCVVNIRGNGIWKEEHKGHANFSERVRESERWREREREGERSEGERER
jgi:hypothetical protein